MRTKQWNEADKPDNTDALKAPKSSVMTEYLQTLQ